MDESSTLSSFSTLATGTSSSLAPGDHILAVKSSVDGLVGTIFIVKHSKTSSSVYTSPPCTPILSRNSSSFRSCKT
ncbi:hypothetical protein BCV72DRAFT_325016 [Rhizopus microsporus var. microsporus]|uniref:Uncharacterized protein n=1 Tax=Rhizopus microsporus var. microsporus TaxID=86635 RepID=A0A1X0QM20_RHIZD|nr:hypothetical protein BCV72DRAFT_325016 [Rhizopus microsporus var. microsporus]